MSDNIKLISNKVLHIIRILELMKQSKGTTIEELCKELLLTRRSVFRLLKIIEQNLGIPFTVNRTSFSSTVTYHLTSTFIECLSEISLPEFRFTFTQALFFYLILKDDSFPSNSTVSHEINKLRQSLKIFYCL